MQNPLLDTFSNLQSIKALKGKVTSSSIKSNKLFISPFPGSTKSLFINLLAKEKKQIFALYNSIQMLNEVRVELDILGLGAKTVLIDDFSSEAIQEKLTDLNNRSSFILLSHYDLLKFYLPAKDHLQKSTTTVQPGSDLGYDNLIEYLNLLNYQRDNYVDSPGEFAVRGSIIDFWSFSERQPCRLEFDGDFLESIRYFDHENQRSSSRVESVSLASVLSNGDEQSKSSIFNYLDNPFILATEGGINDLFKPAKKEIESELPFEDIELIKEIGDQENESESAEDPHVNHLNDDADPEQVLFSHKAEWLIESELGIDNDRFEIKLASPPIINSNFELLFNNLIDYCKKDFTVLISAENDLQGRRLLDLFSEFKDELRNLIEGGKIRIVILPIHKGFLSKEDKLLVLSDYEIFNKPYRSRIQSKSKYKKSRSKDFASIKRGDFIVHSNFGIGQYAGLETIKIGEIEQESIKILYAEGGVVYVNLNYLSLIKKFSSNEELKPRLSVLGSSQWKSTKKKVKSKIIDAARELIKLYAKRKSSDGTAFSPDSIWQKELEASFFYEDTPDQAKVTEEVKGDMESNNPMDRLVCGDVGFGKTEIAVRAAFKAVNDGKQVGLLVPTTILAEQHWNTFKDRLVQFPVNVSSLSRFSTKAKQTETLKQLKSGSVDIVIGTHRLLSKDVEFKDLGLLIIDEEHRFGVMAKEKLRKMREHIDTLTLTATPIPRTLNMSLLGARDLSIIATPPPNRQPIYTKVDKFDILKIREWILNEIKRNGQIYFVHDRVQSIDKLAAYVNKYIPEINIGVAHGQMKPTQLENVIHDFLSKKYHVLMATKIIESGLDIPNVNTIIINRADRFGLAELHQLRGRVGRSDRQAYAYLLVPSLNTITKKAVRRLQAIEEYTDLGEGFNLSMRDLEIRGAGNLLGTEQSGAIDTVGFDMYIKLLDEAVEELRQSEFKSEFKDLPKHIDRSEPKIDTLFEIGIPKDFMPDQSDRLSFYTDLFSVIKVEEINEVRDEMIDRFGRLPIIVERLIHTAELRYYASLALLEKVAIQRNHISIVLPNADRTEFYQNKFSLLMQFILDKHSRTVQFKQQKDVMRLEMLNKYSSPDESLKYIINFCKDLSELVLL
ncbi:MAG: transcription-repair coupling factor [Bacteroidota bacterium]